jgi:hypothetical protein
VFAAANANPGPLTGSAEVVVVVVVMTSDGYHWCVCIGGACVVDPLRACRPVRASGPAPATPKNSITQSVTIIFFFSVRDFRALFSAPFSSRYRKQSSRGRAWKNTP